MNNDLNETLNIALLGPEGSANKIYIIIFKSHNTVGMDTSHVAEFFIQI